MIDIGKQITYWRDGAAEDWAVAEELIPNGRTRHGLYFLHLALEKALKALVCERTQDLAPRIHNLIRLVEIAELQLTQEQLDLLAEMNAFQIEGRYPEQLAEPPTVAEAQSYMTRAEPVFIWLMNQ